jgi:hypothetical protein
MRFRKIPLPAKTYTSDSSDKMMLPELPSIESGSEEWILLEKYTDGLVQDGEGMGRTTLDIRDIPETVSLNWERESIDAMDAIAHFPEPPMVELSLGDMAGKPDMG